MAKIMVCGCSFSAVSNELPGTSWSELLANKLGWELENLARQGCSNGGIRIQIDEVIRQKPTFAIIGPTFFDRMEIPASAAPYVEPTEKKSWNPFMQQHLQDTSISNGYRREDGIKNVNYQGKPYNMICETIFSLAENLPHTYRASKINTDTQNAVKQYVNHIYDANWKQQMDEWIIRDGIMQMFYAGINFFVLPDNLWPAHLARKVFPKELPDQYIITDSKIQPAAVTHMHPCDPNNDPGYHGNELSQQILADAYYNLIKDTWKL